MKMDPRHKRCSPSSNLTNADEVTNDNDDGRENPSRTQVGNVNGDVSSIGVVLKDVANLSGCESYDESGRSSHAAEDSEDRTLGAGDGSGRFDGAEPSKEKHLSVDADDENLRAEADKSSSEDRASDSSNENLSAEVDFDSDDETWSEDGNANTHEDEDWIPPVYACCPTPEDQHGDIKIVRKLPRDMRKRWKRENHYNLAYNCYYDSRKGYKDQDTGYYDLKFELFVDSGGFFLDQLDSRVPLKDSTVFFDGRKPNLQWARGLPAHVDSAGDHSGEDHRYVVLNENIGEFLPEEIVFIILSCLPPAAQFRFRCVCSKWKAVLSKGMPLWGHNVEGRRPPFTIKLNPRARHVSAFCHSERKWYDLPCMVAIRTLLINPKEMPTHAIQATTAVVRADTQCDEQSMLKVVFDWELVAVEGELFCYMSEANNILGHLWVAVCNPMISQLSLLLPPTSPHHYWRDVRIQVFVDQRNKTFRVVVRSGFHMEVFDSVSGEWATIPLPEARDSGLWFFLRNGFLYSVAGFEQLFVLDMVSKSWNEVQVEFPSTKGRKFAIKSSRDEIMLVEVTPKEREYVRVWRLQTDAENDVPLFSLESWEKQNIAQPRSLKSLAKQFREC